MGADRVATLVILVAAAVPVAGQTYPHPIRLIVAFPPGGAVDVIARTIGQALSVRLGQPVVVENKPGSGSNLAGDIAAKSKPDGYTLFHGPDNVFVSNPHIYAKMPFDPIKDLVPVASLVSNQFVLAVHPSGTGQRPCANSSSWRAAPSRRCSTPRSATAASTIWPWSC